MIGGVRKSLNLRGGCADGVYKEIYNAAAFNCIFKAPVEHSSDCLHDDSVANFFICRR